MATPKVQNAYRDPTGDTQDIADLLLVTTSGLAVDADAGASFLVFNNGSNDVLVSSSNALPVSVSGVATAAKQPALGVAGTASADVITIQGIASMTPVLIDGSGVTQPVSIATAVPVTDNNGSLTVDGSITANAGTNLNTSALALESGGNLAAIATAVQTGTIASKPIFTIGGWSQTSSQYVEANFSASGALVCTVTGNLSSITSVNSITGGITAHDGVIGFNPHLMGAYASSTAPADVSANGDMTRLWALLNGSLVANLAVGGTLVTGSAGLPVAQQGTWTVTGTGGSFPVTDSNGSLTVDNNGTFATQSTLQAGTAYVGKVRITDGTNDTTLLNLTNSKPLPVALVDSSGDQVTSFGGGTQYTEDAAAAANPVGTVPVLVRADTPAGAVSTDGDNVAQRGSNYGAAYVTLLDSSGSFVSVGGGTQYDEDTAHVSGDKLTLAGVVRSDTATAQSDADGDRTVLISDSYGRLHVNVGNMLSVGSHDVTNSGTFAVQSTLQSGTNYAGKVRLTDGTNDAEVIALAGYNAQAVALVDGSGNQITSFGGGVQYTEGDTDGTITGTAVMWEDSGDVIVAASANKPLPVHVILSASQATDYGTFTASSTVGNPIMGVYESAPTNPTNGQLGVVGITSNRELKTVAAQSGTWNIADITGTVSLPTGAATEITLANINTKMTACDTGAVVLAAGTASIGKLGANSGVTIGAVEVAGGQSIAVTNSGTFAVQSTLAASATNIAKAEDSASADADVGVPAMAIRKATPANTSGTDGDYEMLQMSAGRLWTSAIIDAALPAGTNAIGKLAANSGVTIGAVELAAAQTLATVTTVSTVTAVTTLTGGGVAHDGVDSGNPVKVGARAAATLSDDTMVANADRTDLVSDLDGALLIRSGFPLGDLISERVTDTGGSSTAFSNFGATASTRNYVTAITVYNSSATAGTVDFRDGTGGSVLWTMPIPAGGGSVIAMGGVPLFCTTANTALAYDVSGALSTVTISVAGFKSKARA